MITCVIGFSNTFTKHLNMLLLCGIEHHKSNSTGFPQVPCFFVNSSFLFLFLLMFSEPLKYNVVLYVLHVWIGEFVLKSQMMDFQ